MEPSMISAAARGQSLPLCAMPLALIQNQTPNRFPDGTASSAMPAAGCEPVPLSSRVPPAIAGQLPALRTESRPKLFDRRRPRTPGAEVLDGNRKAV
jgi:hypothetical protein